MLTARFQLHLNFSYSNSDVNYIERKCPLNLRSLGIFTESTFCKFQLFWTILRQLVPAEIIAKLVIREICEI